MLRYSRNRQSAQLESKLFAISDRKGDMWNAGRVEWGTVHNPSEQIREEDRVIREIRLPRETGPLFVSPGRLKIFVSDFEIRDSDLLFPGADAADAWLDYALVCRYLPPADI